MVGGEREQLVGWDRGGDAGVHEALRLAEITAEVEKRSHGSRPSSLLAFSVVVAARGATEKLE